MASIYDNTFNRSGLYGAPLARTSLNGKNLPETPKIVTPPIVKRAGGAIEGWSAGNKNADLLTNVTA